MEPLPERMVQAHRATSVYTGSSLIAAPYPIVEQVTKVETNSIVVLESRAKQPHKEEGSKLTLGPYKDVAPFTHEQFALHYENSSPFATYTDVVREIEISHWGNVAVEEHYELHNTGAELLGSFSRLDYQHGVIGNSFEELVMMLPGDASEIYYRDVIGNISTSHVFPDGEGKLRFEYMPRFVMFGGWRTQFYMGYNLPASNYITVDGSRFTLSIDFAKDVEDAIIDDMEIRVIFPEGTTDIKVDAPHAISAVETSDRFTYLDVDGRPVVSFRAKNLVSDHNDPMTISYSFSTMNLIWEPLYLIAAFFTVCVLAMLFARVDLSISAESVPDTDLTSGDLERVATLKDLYEKRKEAHENIASGNSGLVRKGRDTLSDVGREVSALIKHLEDSSVRRIANVVERTEEDLSAAVADLERLSKRAAKKASNELEEEMEAARQRIAEAKSFIARLIGELE
eukprot:TRINITY_DN1884_c0_g1_i2.p1 TRINITY_DN1884_c0_g1~~TRINITY_DN1884_c0_g1_i2.p1  ORF type:complete len:455 (+),score=172.88 TRINITY_DN1884_c0_g1_i2:697-2061(+)